MTDTAADAGSRAHSHVFLGNDHDKSGQKTWLVIWLCGFMMIAEIAGGLLFGSIALVADGMHMSTHAGALLLAALAYTYARKYANHPAFSFGTGKLGDLAGFTSAIVLAMIALLIGYESVQRFFSPVPIDFAQAIPIAVLGLAVNIASAWLLSSGGHHHHGHGHDHGHDGHRHDNDHDHGEHIATATGTLVLSVFEDGVPPRFRLRAEDGPMPAASAVTIETIRDNGARQIFAMVNHGTYLESAAEIPEPHQFNVKVSLPDSNHVVAFEEHDHGHDHGDGHASTGRDNNMRAAIVHVMADAAVSVLVIAGLVLARFFGWVWMDPVAGIAGAVVIASWSWGLVRDTGAILLDMTPDQRLAQKVRAAVESDGDRVTDLHLWRLGPGHLGAIVSVQTGQSRGPDHYKRLLSRLPALSHVTVEVVREGSGRS